MLFLRLFLAMLAGLAGHSAYAPSQIFGPRWGNLLRYAIGLLLFIPAQIVVKASIPEREDKGYWGDVERDIVAGLMTAGAVGTGTLIGHFMDRHKEDAK
jgi:hypothetical protein